jgi:hypothetical protein
MDESTAVPRQPPGRIRRWGLAVGTIGSHGRRVIRQAIRNERPRAVAAARVSLVVQLLEREHDRVSRQTQLPRDRSRRGQSRAGAKGTGHDRTPEAAIQFLIDRTVTVERDEHAIDLGKWTHGSRRIVAESRSSLDEGASYRWAGSGS